MTRSPLLHANSTVPLSQESHFQIPLLSCCYLPTRFSQEGTFNCSKNGCNNVNHRRCNNLDRNSSIEQINNSICYNCQIENEMQQIPMETIDKSQEDDGFCLVVPD
eukprot:169064_1